MTHTYDGKNETAAQDPIEKFSRQEHKAHRLSMHISRVCAWNTTRLAFDGFGRVKSGRESEKTSGNYSLCEFQTGKIYHCDLNAAYNIGARYFIRELLKPLPVKDGQDILAKTPGYSKRSTRTLSSFISLNAVLASSDTMRRPQAVSEVSGSKTA